MAELFTSWDIALFYFVNRTLQNPVFDILMPFVTNKYNWIIPVLLLYVWLWWKGGRTGWSAALLIIPVIILSDQISASLLKPFFHRTRPCVALEDVHMLIGLKRSLSFPSSHATNMFAAAALFAMFFPKGSRYYFGFAALVAYSRVYVGVHYPFDVFGGALLGVAISIFVVWIWNLLIASRYEKWPQGQILFRR